MKSSNSTQREKLWCDNDCGSYGNNWIPELMVQIATANVGESAVLCNKCYKKIKNIK